jgi:hypothetical protein
MQTNAIKNKPDLFIIVPFKGLIIKNFLLTFILFDVAKVGINQTRSKDFLKI